MAFDKEPKRKLLTLMFITLGLRFLLYLNGKLINFKKPYSNIMDFHLTVGKSVCIARMGTGRKWSAYAIIQC